MGTTFIMSCGCEHEYQDKKFGKGKRAHNKCGDNGPKKGKARCMVCSTVRIIPNWKEKKTTGGK